MSTGPEGEKRPADVNARVGKNHLRLYSLLALESDAEIGKAAVAVTTFHGGKWKGV
jgi:hypothetical protein